MVKSHCIRFIDAWIGRQLFVLTTAASLMTDKSDYTISLIMFNIIILLKDSLVIQ